MIDIPGHDASDDASEPGTVGRVRRNRSNLERRSVGRSVRRGVSNLRHENTQQPVATDENDEQVSNAASCHHALS